MKVKLTLGDILGIQTELKGLINQETGEKIFSGLLSQDLSLVTKFKLSDLSDELSPIVANVDKLREELIKEKGTEVNGAISIERFINDTEINPVFIEFQEEYNKLLSEQKEIDVYEFSINEFDIKTSERYDSFFKLLKIIRSN
jgi:hypothetical protein